MAADRLQTGVVGQVATVRHETASGRRGIPSGRCGITRRGRAGSNGAARDNVWAVRNTFREVRNNLRAASGRRGTAAVGLGDSGTARNSGVWAARNSSEIPSGRRRISAGPRAAL